MTDTVTNRINGTLKRRVLARLNRTNGNVEIREESWDFGMCDTCSYPEIGFSVYVDGQQVWPSDDYLREFGGYIYADDQGYVTGRTLTTYGQFDNWLNARPFDGEDDER